MLEKLYASLEVCDWWVLSIVKLSVLFGTINPQISAATYIEVESLMKLIA